MIAVRATKRVLFEGAALLDTVIPQLIHFFFHVHYNLGESFSWTVVYSNIAVTLLDLLAEDPHSSIRKVGVVFRLFLELSRHLKSTVTGATGRHIQLEGSKRALTINSLVQPIDFDWAF